MQAYSASMEVQLAYRVWDYLRTAAGLHVVYFTDWQGLGYYSAVGKRQGLALDTTHLVTLLTGPRAWHSARVGGQSKLASEANLRVRARDGMYAISFGAKRPNSVPEHANSLLLINTDICFGPCPR